MPQGKDPIKRIALAPASKVSLANAPAVARSSIRLAILKSLRKHKWNLAAASNELGLDKTAIFTYCEKEYEDAKKNGLVLAFKEKFASPPGKENLTHAANRYNFSADGMRKRLIDAGLIDAKNPTRVHVFDIADVDKVMKLGGPNRKSSVVRLADK